MQKQGDWGIPNLLIYHQAAQLGHMIPFIRGETSKQ